MFDGSLPEIGDLAALDDAALVDAAGGWARTENAACARKLALMAELFTRRTGLAAGEREDWWVDPEAAVGVTRTGRWTNTDAIATRWPGCESSSAAAATEPLTVLPSRSVNVVQNSGSPSR